ncbi:MAG: metallophosphoesterase [Chloroflexi bacterium]|nr:metallophosphoesterase [Chloroflexota bacterium]MCL5273744.1 metallophosphoesterase [Chloroflexota bacterium]
MKLLAISDEVVEWIYSPALLQRCAGVDFVISCGDLPIHYLEFVTSTLNAPSFYVRGNHDLYEFGHGGEVVTEPQGWINLDLQRKRCKGITIAGLEGCIRYKPGVPIQYTQSEQWVRAFWLSRRLLFSRMRGKPGVDIMATHSPAYGIHDGPDHAHTGFKSFNWLIETFKPRLFLHGHQHRNYAPMQRAETDLGGTRVLNIQPYRIIDV